MLRRSLQSRFNDSSDFIFYNSRHESFSLEVGPFTRLKDVLADQLTLTLQIRDWNVKASSLRFRFAFSFDFNSLSTMLSRNFSLIARRSWLSHARVRKPDDRLDFLRKFHVQCLIGVSKFSVLLQGKVAGRGSGNSADSVPRHSSRSVHHKTDGNCSRYEDFLRN